MSIIKWKNKITNFTGRNGYFKCTGLEFMFLDWHVGKQLMLTPFTSRNKRGKCDITIPLEELPNVINKLQEFNKEYNHG